MYANYMDNMYFLEMYVNISVCSYKAMPFEALGLETFPSSPVFVVNITRYSVAFFGFIPVG